MFHRLVPMLGLSRTRLINISRKSWPSEIRYHPNDQEKKTFSEFPSTDQNTSLKKDEVEDCNQELNDRDQELNDRED